MSLCSKGATHTSLLASAAVIGGLALGGVTVDALAGQKDSASGKHEFASPETIASIWGDEETSEDMGEDATGMSDEEADGAQGDADPDHTNDMMPGAPHSSDDEASDDDMTPEHEAPLE